MSKTLVFVTAAISAFLVSVACSKTDSQVSPGKTNDPEGTVTVNLRIDYFPHEMGAVGDDTGEIYVSRANNLVTQFDHNWGREGRRHQIVYLGQGSSLGSINTNKLPETGWAEEAAAIVGGLYIICFVMPIQTGFDIELPSSYYGLQVIDTIVGTDNGILGYTVKYCPFTPGKGWNQ